MVYDLNNNSVPAAPAGKNLVKDNFFEFKAIDGDGNAVENFDEPIELTVHYGEETEDDYLENTLDVYKYSGGTWTSKGCTLDSEANTLTCSLNGFSTYGVFGEEIVITSDDEDDEEDEIQKAKIDSWKASVYTNNNGVACPNKLKLEISGKYFDKDAEVKIGNQKAYEVKKTSKRKLVARFCLDDLLDTKTKLKRKIHVINPEAEDEKADKKINLRDLKYQYDEMDFDTRTAEGATNIQKALAEKGFLEAQYITGFYGEITQESIKNFQSENGLPATGYFGSMTKAKLAE